MGGLWQPARRSPLWRAERELGATPKSRPLCCSGPRLGVVTLAGDVRVGELPASHPPEGDRHLVASLTTLASPASALRPSGTRCCSPSAMSIAMTTKGPVLGRVLVSLYDKPRIVSPFW